MLNDARTQGVGGASVSSAFQQTPQLSPWHYSAFACRQWPITQGYLRRRRAVLRYSTAKTDPQSVWLQQLIARRGHNCAAVALANTSASWCPIRDPWVGAALTKKGCPIFCGKSGNLIHRFQPTPFMRHWHAHGLKPHIDISDPDDCTGDSQAFVEGCQESA